MMLGWDSNTKTTRGENERSRRLFLSAGFFFGVDPMCYK